MPVKLRTPGLIAAVFACALGACVSSGPAQTQEGISAIEYAPEQAPAYADLVDMALAAELVAVVTIDEQIVVPAERAPGVAPGNVRLYLEVLTQSLLASPSAVGESLTFLVDRPQDRDGDAPDLEQRSFIVFGDRVPQRPAALQLLSSDAMLAAGPEIERRVREVLTQLAASDALPAITGLRDVISVPGNLAGESETQMFIETAGGLPVSLSVIRRPGMTPAWGVSLGEIVDQNAMPPEPETIAWYRFACELPAELPNESFLQADRDSRQRAQEDYTFVRDALGPCERRL